MKRKRCANVLCLFLFTFQTKRVRCCEQYDVLLILTDGALSDYDRTVDRIISASQKVPLSIIIVGIGNRDFKKMIDLDCDNDLLKSQDGTKRAARGLFTFTFCSLFRHFLESPYCFAQNLNEITDFL